MPRIDIFEQKNSKERRTVILTVTNKCNLRCKYCYEHHGEECNGEMDFHVAKQLIKKEMLADDGFDFVEIQFFGGEPLMVFPLIKKIVGWFRTQQWKKDHVFFIPTNGTLLTEEMKRWMVSNRDDVKLGFSLDGNKKAHDLSRDNSYDLLAKNIPFFKLHWPEQITKMTICQETIPYIYNSIIELEEKDLNFAANVVFENIWEVGEKKDKLLEIYEKQLNLLVDYYAGNPELIPVCLVDRKIEYLSNSNNHGENLTKFCGGGVQTVAYDVNGDEYPCHRFIPSFNESFQPPQSPVNERTHWLPESCRDCRLLIICPTCIAFNWQINKDTSVRTSFHCESFKLEILATARLQAIKINQKMINSETDEEKFILRKKIESILNLVTEGV